MYDVMHLHWPETAYDTRQARNKPHVLFVCLAFVCCTACLFLGADLAHGRLAG
jgi:hypothetical protein